MQVLEKAYADLVSERDRLRNARAEFTRGLGPLPASAAIAIALAGSVGGKVNPLWLGEALAVLGLLIFIGTVYSGLPPYRLLRAERQPDFDPHRPAADSKEVTFGMKAPDPKVWLTEKINLEQAICGRLRREQPVCLKMDVKNLQEALDVERWAFALSQLLFAEIILVLVIGLAIRDASFSVQAGVGGGIALATLLALRFARRKWHLLSGLRQTWLSPTKKEEGAD